MGYGSNKTDSDIQHHPKGTYPRVETELKSKKKIYRKKSTIPNDSNDVKTTTEPIEVVRHDHFHGNKDGRRIGDGKIQARKGTIDSKKVGEEKEFKASRSAERAKLQRSKSGVCDSNHVNGPPQKAHFRKSKSTIVNGRSPKKDRGNKDVKHPVVNGLNKSRKQQKNTNNQAQELEHSKKREEINALAAAESGLKSDIPRAKNVVVSHHVLQNEYRENGHEERVQSESAHPKVRQPATVLHRQASHSKKHGASKKESSYFRQYETIKQVRAGLKDGRYHYGTLRQNPNYKDQAYITLPGIDKDIFIEGIKARNRACDGDVVTVKIFAFDNRKDSSRGTLRRKFPQGLRKVEVNKILSANDSEDLRPKGEIVYLDEVTSKMRQNLRVGILSDVKAKEGQYTFSMVDGAYPSKFRVLIEGFPLEYTGNREMLRNTLFALQYVSWDKNSKLPVGKFVSVVGLVGDPKAEIRTILIDKRIRDEEHSCSLSATDNCMDKLAKLDIASIPNDGKSRKDCSDYVVFTVDPPTAKDLDDALHCKKLGPGIYEIGVHIADVSHYLKENSSMDKEAQSRATSVYLVNRVIPMLPHSLSDDLCSLNPGTEKLTFSVIWKVKINDESDEVIMDEPWFGRTRIKSLAKLDYNTAQLMIDGEIDVVNGKGMDLWSLSRRPPVDEHSSNNNVLSEIVESVKSMHLIASKLRRFRYKNGCLSINKPKLHVEVDEMGKVLSVGEYARGESHYMVEEFMIAANCFVAKFLEDHVNLQPVLLRHHPLPSTESLERLQSLVLRHTKLPSFEINSSKKLAESLLLAEQMCPEILPAIRALLVRPMKPASYMVVTDDGTHSHHHYALNAGSYTHFTSPIRRYADVLVHRQLSYILQNGACSQTATSSKYSKNKVLTLERYAINCNMRREEAKKAEEECLNFYLLSYLERKHVIAMAIVLSFGTKSCTIYFPKYNIETKVDYSAFFVNSKHDEINESVTLSRISMEKEKPQNTEIKKLMDAHSELSKLLNERQWSEITFTYLTMLNFYLMAYKHEGRLKLGCFLLDEFKSIKDQDVKQ